MPPLPGDNRDPRECSKIVVFVVRVVKNEPGSPQNHEKTLAKRAKNDASGQKSMIFVVLSCKIAETYKKSMKTYRKTAFLARNQ